MSRSYAVFARERRGRRPGFAVFGETWAGDLVLLVGRNDSEAQALDALTKLSLGEFDDLRSVILGQRTPSGTWRDRLVHPTPEGTWSHGRRLFYRR